jgi:hypothetical protein
MDASRCVTQPAIYEKRWRGPHVTASCSVHLLPNALPVDFIIQRRLELSNVQSQRLCATVKRLAIKVRPWLHQEIMHFPKLSLSRRGFRSLSRYKRVRVCTF